MQRVKSRPWLQSGEVCRELGITPPTLSKLVQDGRIGVLKIPGIGRRRYNASDVAAILAANSVNATIASREPASV